MEPIISIRDLGKTYAGGFTALKNINLDIRPGEIFALLGPNGAGKTTLISIVCGIVNASQGSVTVSGYDIQRDYRRARREIGLVPQEISTDAFESVWSAVKFSRGLFGKGPNSNYLENILRQLSLWEKKSNKIITLSGGMKRRLMIAKALSHEPHVLFLDEPTAGVDVELRQDMWAMVRGLRDSGVTIILTTHYIEEAEEMADRVGVINRGELVVVEEKNVLMQRMGEKELSLTLPEPLQKIPDALADLPLRLNSDGSELIYRFDIKSEDTGIAEFLRCLNAANIDFRDLHTRESSLEEIFVNLVHGGHQKHEGQLSGEMQE
ncbi:ABC transporter ATP-binding protein [Microbulbifer sp. 2205BS26-8]|uniref:ABC transporter ATP-binding protein n=1 Tax=Microbulbifer sp. 2205BS26-8 TaxID=3064386 RepID=UPI00273CF9BB|nr:ABC transporter ATP-binding protein [Microbulbifer sp. 2205BS26-8]MDP5209579.1 ABC transporter ATP-binding protein [Microbulbifer sp. 2205BS26-8]